MRDDRDGVCVFGNAGNVTDGPVECPVFIKGVFQMVFIAVEKNDVDAFGRDCLDSGDDGRLDVGCGIGKTLVCFERFLVGMLGGRQIIEP